MAKKRTEDPAETSGTTGPPTSRKRRGHRRRYVAVALLAAVPGLVGATFAADAVARNDTEKSQRALRSSAAEIASTLELAIQHEEDLIVSASGFVTSNPNASNTQFVQWANSVRALERYPEITGFGANVVVPAANLETFAKFAEVDPAGPLSADGSFQVVPAGDRPFYCLSTGSVYRDQAAFSLPAGFDFCGLPDTGPALLATLNSGKGSYLPLKTPTVTLLAIQVPVYRDGIVPPTVEGRQAAFVGWVGLGMDPTILLKRALQGHRNTAVTFRYRASDNDVVFRSGKAPTDAHSTTTDLHNGWTVQTSAAVAIGGILENRTALGLLIAGIILSALLAGLVFVLASSRDRALRLVEERTGELRHLALHDALTGLPNRALIMDRIESLLARNRRHGTSGAVLFVDLDEFKNVNDTLGHEAGDRLLIAMATRLQSTLRDVDTIGRMGGDEFVVLIDGALLDAAPELVAQRLLTVMRQPFDLEGVTMPLIVNTSIGIAIGERTTGGELLRDADIALYEAKAAGKNRYEIFNPKMQTEITHRIELEFDLRSALDDHQFGLVYLPIYNLDDLSLVGVEALLRWEHPTLGALQPDAFISILEQTGQIREVGRWVLDHACAQMAAWHAQGDILDVSVNVSARQLDSEGIVDDIRNALQASGLPGTSLIIEVTETALMRNAEATAHRLQAIKDQGVRIAVDDFGSGYSSLAYLRQFPVDCLKIDRMFTNAIATSPESKVLIGTLVQLGKDLGLKTLAEGVETPGEMDHLRGEHVDEAQGFLLAKPLDAEALESQLLEPVRPPASHTSGQK